MRRLNFCFFILFSLSLLAQDTKTDQNYKALVRHGQVPRASARTSSLTPAFEDVHNLGEAATRLANALSKAGYSGQGWAYLSEEEDKASHPLPHTESHIFGFSVVTEVEKVNTDGSPASAQQRHDISNPITDSSLAAEIKRILFGAPVGTYRVFLFVVTTEPKDISKQPQSQSPDSNTAFLQLDQSFLMSSRFPLIPILADITTSKWKPVAMAFVYEFKRSAVNGDMVFVDNSSVDAEAQLRASGIYKQLALQ